MDSPVLRRGLAAAALLLWAGLAAADTTISGPITFGAGFSVTDATVSIPIPASCDGFRANNGVTTSGSPVFTSATANFQTADVGKPISIQGAGANFFILTASLNAGGAGHVVGDRVTFANGVIARVAAVSAGAITEFEIWNVGSAATQPATIAQTSTTGAGTGAVLNTTWQRENLVTTIAVRNSATSVNLAANANATATSLKWGYGTDYSTQINAALASGVQLPKGTCGIASSIAFTSQITLLGKGAGTNALPQTVIIWLGAVGGIPLDSGTGAGTAAGNILGNFNVDGLCAAGTGLRVHRTAYSTFYPIIVESTTNIGIDIDSTATSGTQGLTWYDPQGGQSHDCSSYAQGIRLGPGNSSFNVNHIKMYGPRVVTRNGTGFACYNADTNLIFGLFGQGTGGGSGKSLRLYGGQAAAEHCRSNKFYFADPLAGTTADSAAQPSVNNDIELVTESGAAFPTIVSGATIDCRTMRGVPCGNLNTSNLTQFLPSNAAISTTGQRNALGLGTTATFTARTTGIVDIEITGAIEGTGITNNVNHLILAGTGSAPATGIDTSTISPAPISVGATPSFKPNVASAPVPFVLKGRASGLTLGTTYWIDIGAQPFAGVGTVTYSGLAVIVKEAL